MTTAEGVLEELNKSFEPLSRADLQTLLPDISQRTIERALAVLQHKFKIEKVGQGRSTKYKKMSEFKN